jgi:hypothetical protein
MSDIEDFTTDQLRAEIRRREEADRKGRCWYCGRNLAAHTCKYATSSPCPGWVVQPPRFVRTEDCMANEVEYWQVDARNPVTGRCSGATGATSDEATAKCINRIRNSP